MGIVIDAEQQRLSRRPRLHEPARFSPRQCQCRRQRARCGKAEFSSCIRRKLCTRMDRTSKLAFVSARSTGNDHVRSAHAACITLYRAGGTVIRRLLITGLRSDLPGQVTAQVTENVYDSPTGRARLIPQGARLIGTYDSRSRSPIARAFGLDPPSSSNGRSIVLGSTQSRWSKAVSTIELLMSTSRALLSDHSWALADERPFGMMSGSRPKARAMAERDLAIT